MLFGFRDVIDLMVFDTMGNLLVKIVSMQENDLYYDEECQYLMIRDAMLNTNMLEMLGTKQIHSESDYDKFLSPKTNVISMGSKKKINCKLIGIGYLKDEKTGKDIEVKIEIPNAKLMNKFQLRSNNEASLANFNYVFEILPFNQEGDLYKLYY